MDEPTCSVEGCEKRVAARGMCGTCYHRWWNKNRRSKPAVAPRTCQQCGKQFTKTPKDTYAYFRTRKFCGAGCHAASKRGKAFTPNLQVPLSCAQCGAAFTAAPWQIKAGRRFCGPACGVAYHDRGITAVSKRIRMSAEMREWRLAVFERDDWTCQECGVRGGVVLNVDHIKPFAYFPELRFDVDNGRTLCEPRHRETETYGIKGVRLMRKGGLPA